MKIVELIGGLGNQMFQYAFLLALRQHFPEEEIRPDFSLFERYKRHNGLEIGRVFGAALDQAPLDEVRRMRFYSENYLLSRILLRLPLQKRTMCVEKLDMRFDSSVFERKGPRYFSGYWQTPRYYEGVGDAIRSAYRFPEPEDSRNRELAAELAEKPGAVAVHVRRGDYVRDPMFRGICEKNYYERALEKIREDALPHEFFVFSDDPAWCRANLAPLFRDEPVSFIDWNTGKNSFYDMRLMGLCRNQILANSTFSWWSAFLNPAPGRIVAPEKWLNIRLAGRIQMSGWITV